MTKRNILATLWFWGFSGFLIGDYIPGSLAPPISPGFFALHHPLSSAVLGYLPSYKCPNISGLIPNQVANLPWVKPDLFARAFLGFQTGKAQALHQTITPHRMAWNPPQTVPLFQDIYPPKKTQHWKHITVFRLRNQLPLQACLDRPLKTIWNKKFTTYSGELFFFVTFTLPLGTFPSKFKNFCDPRHGIFPWFRSSLFSTNLHRFPRRVLPHHFPQNLQTAHHNSSIWIYSLHAKMCVCVYIYKYIYRQIYSS